MKNILLLALVAACLNTTAQNVGIGTTTPLTTIDVRGNLRLGGFLKYTSFDSASGKISWTNSNLFVPGSQYLMQHSASGEGLYYGSGKLLYRGVVDTAFYTDWITGNGFFKGLVGIGTTAPGTKLDINGINGWDLQFGEGDVRIGNPVYRMKFGVALDGGGAGAANIMQYGAPGGYNALSLGSQGNYLLRLYGSSKIVEMSTDVASRVGIGNSTPTEKLEVTGNIKADSYKYTSPKTFYYAIPDGAFTARSSTEIVQKSFSGGGASITNAATNFGLVTPVYLPHNARLVSVRVDFYDASVTQDVVFYFLRQFSGGFSFDVTISSTGSSGLNTQTAAISPSQLIDNSINAYEIFVVPSTGVWNTQDLAIRRVIMGYTLDEAH